MTFDDLKPGDKVILWGGFGGPKLENVDAVFKQYLVVAGIEFNKKDGHYRGVRYSSTHIRLCTAENLEAMRDHFQERRENQLAQQLREVLWRRFPIETLLQVAELIGIKTDE